MSKFKQYLEQVNSIEILDSGLDPVKLDKLATRFAGRIEDFNSKEEYEEYKFAYKIGYSNGYSDALKYKGK